MAKFEKLEIKGSVGQIGDHNSATNMIVAKSDAVFYQAFSQIATDLDKLQKAALASLKERTATPEEVADLETIKEAKNCARNQDGPGVLSAVKRFGSWSLDVAKDIGVALTAEILKGKLGLS